MSNGHVHLTDGEGSGADRALGGRARGEEVEDACEEMLDRMRVLGDQLAGVRGGAQEREAIHVFRESLENALPALIEMGGRLVDAVCGLQAETHRTGFEIRRTVDGSNTGREELRAQLRQTIAALTDERERICDLLVALEEERTESRALRETVDALIAVIAGPERLVRLTPRHPSWTRPIDTATGG